MTYRYRGHSVADAGQGLPQRRTRSPSTAREDDPIELLRAQARERGLVDDDGLEEMRGRRSRRR